MPDPQPDDLPSRARAYVREGRELTGNPFFPFERPIAVQISHAEQDHHAMLRRRSYELAIARGHVR